MSSTGVKKSNSIHDRTVKGLVENEKDFIQSLKVLGETSQGGLGSPGSTARGGPLGNYLPIAGGTMIGPTGHVEFIMEVASGVLDISRASENFYGYIILNPEGGAADELDTILPGEDAMQQRELWIEVFNQTITFTDADNIITPNNSPVAVNPGEIVHLIYSLALNGWVLLNVSSGAGAVQDPIIVNSHDEGTITAVGVNIDWSLANHHYGIANPAGGNLQITMSNLPSLTKYQPLVLQLKQPAGGGITIEFMDSFLNGTKLFVDTQPNAVNTWVFHTDGAGNILAFNTVAEDSIPVDMSDEVNTLNPASGSTPFYTMFADWAFYVTDVLISVNTPGSGGSGIEVDIKKNGTTIFSTRPTINNGDNGSWEGAPAPVISTPQILKYDKLEFFLTVRDTNNTAIGLKSKLIGVKN